MDCEIYSGPCSAKAKRILDAMARSAKGAGVKVHRSPVYTNRSQWYMTWGLGHPERRKWTDKHLASGGHVIAWDLGYWDRNRRFRLTIDADHPHRLVKDMPHARLPDIQLRNDYDPEGPIIIVGMGRKSTAVYEGAQGWELDAIKRAQYAYTGHQVLVRTKYTKTPIEDVLRGASLVVCRHSNVALDACIAGIPVVCEDGIACSLYGSDIRSPVIPTRAQRRQLLANAAWWQWAPSEAGQAWQFIKGQL